MMLLRPRHSKSGWQCQKTTQVCIYNLFSSSTSEANENMENRKRIRRGNGVYVMTLPWEWALEQIVTERWRVIIANFKPNVDEKQGLYQMLETFSRITETWCDESLRYSLIFLNSLSSPSYSKLMLPLCIMILEMPNGLPGSDAECRILKAESCEVNRGAIKSGRDDLARSFWCEGPCR
jgi:hypothetical protein